MADTSPSAVRKVHGILTPKERRSALILMGMMLVGAVLETLGMSLVIPAFALFMEPDLAGSYPRLGPVLDALGNPTRAELVTGGMVALVGIYLIKAAFLAVLAWRQARFAFAMQARLSHDLFSIYLHQPYTFHLQRNSAQLIRTAIGEVGTFTFTCVLPGLMLFTELSVLAGIVVLLLVVEPAGALIVVLVLGGSSWGLQRSSRAWVARWGRERQHHDLKRTQYMLEGLGGAKDVKLLGREDHFLAQYHAHNARGARAEQMQYTLQQLPRLWLELLAMAGLATLVLTMLARGHEMARILVTLGLFATAAFRLMPSGTRIMTAAHQLLFGLPVIDTLHQELNLGGRELAGRTKGASSFHKTIQVSDVTYSYPDASGSALNHVSVVIRKGEAVGLIGPSGCGKSTLVDVVLGLLTPDSGQVLVDSTDIQTNLRAWQDQIGYVPQSVYLTDDTLKRNVAFGLPDDQIDDMAVQRAIRAAQLEEFVASQPNGLASMVGERGVRLSGGEHQRIGIARALYHDPAVLVLDEATSALDTATERGVMQAVMALRGSKTVLIVAHRFSTVEQCDRIYRLEQGLVTAEGKPSEMLALNTVASTA